MGLAPLLVLVVAFLTPPLSTTALFAAHGSSRFILSVAVWKSTTCSWNSAGCRQVQGGCACEVSIRLTRDLRLDLPVFTTVVQQSRLRKFISRERFVLLLQGLRAATTDRFLFAAVEKAVLFAASTSPSSIGAALWLCLCLCVCLCLCACVCACMCV